MSRALEAVLWALLGVAVRPVVGLLGLGEAEAAHSGIREAPAARPRHGDGEAHAAVRQPAAIALVQGRELPGGIEVPDLGHRGPAPPARRVGFRQGQASGHEEHLAWGSGGGSLAESRTGTGRGAAGIPAPGEQRVEVAAEESGQAGWQRG